eukprot:1159437-Pelagomonas_calceolata.AAC.3
MHQYSSARSTAHHAAGFLRSAHTLPPCHSSLHAPLGIYIHVNPSTAPSFLFPQRLLQNGLHTAQEAPSSVCLPLKTTIKRGRCACLPSPTVAPGRHAAHHTAGLVHGAHRACTQARPAAPALASTVLGCVPACSGNWEVQLKWHDIETKGRLSQAAGAKAAIILREAEAAASAEACRSKLLMR